MKIYIFLGKIVTLLHVQNRQLRKKISDQMQFEILCSSYHRPLQAWVIIAVNNFAVWNPVSN